jgi:DNA-binding GntR family transcriptional regulator
MSDESGRPPLEYVRVANALAARIAAGEFAPGARLPREQELATEYGVSYGTVRRAMDVLRERRLVITQWGKGNIVREPDGGTE